MNAIENIAVQDLLPQKPPFVMVDKLVSSDEECAVSELEVRPDNVFFANGHLSSSGLVENIAQTCAAGIGYKNISNGVPVKIGVIGAVSNMNILRLPCEGEHLTTIVKYVQEVFQMTLFDAIIKSGDEVLANASIKTALIDAEAQ